MCKWMNGGNCENDCRMESVCEPWDCEHMEAEEE